MSIEALGALWQTEGRNGSSHYGVNGRNVGQFVKERDIAWTNGDWASNKRSVTIEVANDSGAPDWTVSDETMDTLIKLIADIARRNGLGLLAKGPDYSTPPSLMILSYVYMPFNKLFPSQRHSC